MLIANMARIGKQFNLRMCSVHRAQVPQMRPSGAVFGALVGDVYYYLVKAKARGV